MTLDPDKLARLEQLLDRQDILDCLLRFDRHCNIVAPRHGRLDAFGNGRAIIDDQNIAGLGVDSR